jgi:hypothetical protein
VTLALTEIAFVPAAFAILLLALALGRGIVVRVLSSAVQCWFDRHRPRWSQGMPLPAE